jgi:hypothetical protein
MTELVEVARPIEPEHKGKPRKAAQSSHLSIRKRCQPVRAVMASMIPPRDSRATPPNVRELTHYALI